MTPAEMSPEDELRRILHAAVPEREIPMLPDPEALEQVRRGGEQRRRVKQHKDRIDKAIERALGPGAARLSGPGKRARGRAQHSIRAVKFARHFPRRSAGPGSCSSASAAQDQTIRISKDPPARDHPADPRPTFSSRSRPDTRSSDRLPNDLKRPAAVRDGETYEVSRRGPDR